MTIQDIKRLVWDYWHGMNRGAELQQLSEYWHDDVVWHGFEPFRNLSGTTEICETFWEPLLAAIPDLTRRPYLFIGGDFEGSDWVCGTGDLVGTFVND